MWSSVQQMWSTQRKNIKKIKESTKEKERIPQSIKDKETFILRKCYNNAHVVVYLSQIAQLFKCIDTNKKAYHKIGKKMAYDICGQISNRTIRLPDRHL